MKPSVDLMQIARALDPMAVESCRVVAGFDGFVDEMISLVAERRSFTDYTPVPDIATFGKIVSAAAGHSSLKEIVVNHLHPGGCAINLADGLASLGVKVDCFATLGDPIHSAFKEVAAKCQSVHTWGREPGRTLAFEFNDGKFMFSAVKQLADFTPEAVRAFLSDSAYFASCNQARVIALTNWTLYPHMTAVWHLLQREVFSQLSHRPHFLVDLVDPSTRSSADILEMLECLRGFESAGPVTLGLNANEANILCRLLQLDCARGGSRQEDTLSQATQLRQRLGLSNLVIHHVAYAVSAGLEGDCMLVGPYCANPKKSTGAGDRFNAGYCLGLALGRPSNERLALACAVSGYFVRNAQSASLKELRAFFGEWQTNAEKWRKEEVERVEGIKPA